MRFLTNEIIFSQGKIDSDEDPALIEIYGNAAEIACERVTDRRIFADQQELEADQATAVTELTAAYLLYDTEIAAAGALTDERVRAHAIDRANHKKQNAILKHDAAVRGIIVNDDIMSAALLIFGHLYRNREDVVTGQGAAAVKVPMASSDILYNYIWIG